MLLARRFHNDAVRDTLALRERPPVRWLRLGGTAPLPTYFEIAERAQVVRGATPASSRCVRRRASCCSTRTARVLLFCGSDPAGQTATHRKWWFTVGGQSRPGETLPQAAAREV